jgi:hypothetical protein
MTNWNDGIMWGVGNAGLVPTGMYFLKDKGLFYYTFDGSAEDGSTAVSLNIGCLISNGNSFYVGGTKNSTPKIYKNNLSLADSNNAAFFESPFYITDGKTPKTFQTVEFFLSEPLTGSDSIILQYRTTKNGSWTPHATYNFATWGGKDYISDSFAPQTRQIQFKVILNGLTKLRLIKVT